MQTPKQAVQVYRCGKWQELEGEGVLVGDVISIGRPRYAHACTRVCGSCEKMEERLRCAVSIVVLVGHTVIVWLLPALLCGFWHTNTWRPSQL